MYPTINDFCHTYENFLVEINIQSLPCHHDQLKVGIDKFAHPPKIIATAVTEARLTKNDTGQTIGRKHESKKNYTLLGYQSVDSKPRKS